MKIFDGLPSLMAQRHLNENLNAQSRSLERLASGSRLNHASDDAAGLALSEQMRSRIRSLRQNIRNAQDGISIVQIAEGGMSEVSQLVIRLRELAIQSSSDTVGDVERECIELEVQQLKQEIDRIAETTEFNGKKLLRGHGTGLSLQIGPGNDDSVDRYELDDSKIRMDLYSLGIEDLSLSDQDEAQSWLGDLDLAQDLVIGSRAELGAFQNRLQSTLNQLSSEADHLSIARGRITDVDFAQESSELLKSQILISAGLAVLAQAQMTPSAALKLLQS